MRKFLVSLLTLSLLIIHPNCGGDGSVGSIIKVSASLAQSDYRTARRFNLLDQIWATLVEGIAYAAGPSVTELWGVPLYDGEFHPSVFDSVKKATPFGGQVSIDLDQNNWVLLLIDGEQAAKKDQVVGYVSMTAGDSSLNGFPLSNAIGDIDLGELTSSGDETSSSRTSSDNASALSLTVEQLAKLAKSDDGIKTVKNAYRNYDGTTFFSVKPFYIWRHSNATSAISNTFSSPATLVNSHFYGYLFYMSSNHSAIDFNAICAQSTLMTLAPPTTVSNVSGSGSWSPGSPLTSAGSSQGVSGNSCGAGNLYLRDDTAEYGSYQFNFSASSGGSNEYLAPPIPAGDWVVKVGSTTIGEFEGNIGSIFENDDTTKPIVFIPSIKVNTSGGNVASVEVKWYLRNSSTGDYEEITDAALLDQMNSVGVYLTNYNVSPRQEESSASMSSATGYTFTPSETFSVSSGLSVDVGYTFNNIAIHIEFRI